MSGVPGRAFQDDLLEIFMAGAPHWSRDNRSALRAFGMVFDAKTCGLFIYAIT